MKPLPRFRILPIFTILFIHLLTFVGGAAVRGEVGTIPKPEHPTPDAVRAHWLNLNGPWRFRFDPRDEGLNARWQEAEKTPGFDRQIVVPFGWESKLSGIGDTKYRGVAWYRREVRVPAEFPREHRVWLCFGAVDHRADVWVNGKKVAEHEGGYSPFAADITSALTPDRQGEVVVRVFDPTDAELPTGKQVYWYTPTSGIWQTVWLESRPATHIARWSVRTSFASDTVALAEFEVEAAGIQPGEHVLTIQHEGADGKSAFAAARVGFLAAEAGPRKIKALVRISDAKPWSPESPYLYENIVMRLDKSDGLPDIVTTYLGLRTIERGRYGDAPYERILLNGKPVYLRGALDQSFNPDGIYTAPDDAFLRRDIESAKEFGLNMLRIHIKPDEPRRLYWADKLGVMIMEDMPNTWRQSPKARAAWESTMREIVVRDRNHPSIIAWVAFNETWGLGSPAEFKANRDTQEWVRSMTEAIRKLDPARLIEDNSPCNFDHVETDINSWHFYIDDHNEAKRHIEDVVAQTKPGSGFNYCPDRSQGTAPLINSEYGGVSAGGGDRDVSWSFRDLTTLLRGHPKIQGYVYTELSDIEWEHNGFLDYDRSRKRFGYEAFVPKMTIADLQGADFIGHDAPPVLTVKAGDSATIPLFVSHYSQRPGPASLSWSVVSIHRKADGPPSTMTGSPGAPLSGKQNIAWKPYDVTKLEPLKFQAPAVDRRTVGAVALVLNDQEGRRIAANFVNLIIEPKVSLSNPSYWPQGDLSRPPAALGASAPVGARSKQEAEADAQLEAFMKTPRKGASSGQRVVKPVIELRFAPTDYAAAEWSGPIRSVAGNVSGSGSGFFEYRFQLPEAVVKAKPIGIGLRLEASSKADREQVDWAERSNPQDNPQSDDRLWPSWLEVVVNGQALGRVLLEDDPADARGVLSHRNGIEHGSYGEYVQFGRDGGRLRLSPQIIESLGRDRTLTLRLQVPKDAKSQGGLRIFSENTGRLGLQPSLLIETDQPLNPASASTIRNEDDDPAHPWIMDSIAERRKTLLSTGEAPQPTVWAYATDAPAKDWTAPEFDDRQWKRGPSGFGAQGTPAIAVRTPWRTPSIWLRTTVELPDAVEPGSLTFRLFHDEDVEIFVNGEKVREAEGYTTSYRDMVLNPEQASAFKPGKNTIAVRCRQTSGGQGVDLGLTCLVKPRNRPALETTTKPK